MGTGTEGNPIKECRAAECNRSHSVLTAQYYNLLKATSSASDVDLLDSQSYLGLSRNQQPPEISNTAYLQVLDKKADDKHTILTIINQLHQEFIIFMQKKWLVFEGDAVTYERIQSRKLEYGSELVWIIPFPGNWHLLKNFQEVLI